VSTRLVPPYGDGSGYFGHYTGVGSREIFAYVPWTTNAVAPMTAELDPFNTLGVDIPLGDHYAMSEEVQFTAEGFYMVTACIVTRVVFPAQDDERLLNVKTLLHYDMNWGGTGG
jgi:hypothetical protein